MRAFGHSFMYVENISLNYIKKGQNECSDFVIRSTDTECRTKQLHPL